MNQQFNYSFNVTGNAVSFARSATSEVESMNSAVKKSVGVWDSLQGKIVAFNQAEQLVSKFSHTVGRMLEPGAALNASMADLSAISGETGESLKLIERYARDAAKAFGGTAAQNVESYKLLLSQLSPELAKQPKALKAMGDNISILSKQMGGNTVAAAEVLTTAMNQYGVSMDNPIAASMRMSEMMNIMAAAAREGSAELPAIKAALEQAGMAAKAAGVSFEETNAAIQVLDKAGKKGSEGGVALRNVMTTLGRGRFLPKEMQDELISAGVNINDLTDKSKSLGVRLSALKGVVNDTALFTKLFGRENANAAMALVTGIDTVQEYTDAITGTNTAYDQAAIVMDTYNERKARVLAQFEDMKIAIFNATGNFGIWLEVLTSAMVPLAQVTPLLMAMGKGIRFVTLNFAAFGKTAVAACRAVSVAIMSIPIIGWIAAAIAALVALGVYFWNTSAKFRAVLKGLAAAFVATFKGIWTLAKTVFSGIGDLILAALSFDGAGIKAAIKKVGGAYADFGMAAANAFNDAYHKEMEKSEREKAEKEAQEGTTDWR